MIGVYYIKGPTGVYVGQAADIKRRWRMHRSLLSRGEDSIHLQRAWNLYGEQLFEFIILETCEIEQLTEREQHWLDVLKPLGLYNNAPAAGSTRGWKFDEEQLTAHRTKQNSIETRTAKARSLTGNTYHRPNLEIFNKDPVRRAKISATLTGKFKKSPTTWKLRDGRQGRSGRELAALCAVSCVSVNKLLREGFTADQIAERYGIL